MNPMLRLAVILAIVGAALQLPGCAWLQGQRGDARGGDDAAITARVKSALAQASDLKGQDVNVDTYRGVVQLSGFVDDAAVAARAVAIAGKVPGVASVKNDMRIKPGEDATGSAAGTRDKGSSGQPGQPAPSKATEKPSKGT